MPYLVKNNVAAKNLNGDTFVHEEGSVISDWELDDFTREKIKEGTEWYRRHFEPLLESEAHSYRVRATSQATPRYYENQLVAPPWDDYVGLHPTEIMQRMREADAATIDQVKRYESVGMNRQSIMDFISPAQMQPFQDYDLKDVRYILEKFSIMSDSAVRDAIAYEKAHKNRPAIVEYDRDLYEANETDTERKTEGATA